MERTKRFVPFFHCFWIFSNLCKNPWFFSDFRAFIQYFVNIFHGIRIDGLARVWYNETIKKTDQRGIYGRTEN